MKKYLIIYHKEDNDGVFSGAIFYDYINNILNIDKSLIDTLPADYNMLTEFAKSNTPEELHEKYDTIVLTDISFNDSKYMKKLFKEFNNNFIWCDHHAPIIKESLKLNFDGAVGVRNTQKSAILCVYEYLYDTFNEIYQTIDKEPSTKFPEIYRVLSGWDSWSYEREGYEFEYVRNVNKGATFTYNLDFNKIVKLVENVRIGYNTNLQADEHFIYVERFNDVINSWYNIGKNLNEYDDQVMEGIITNNGDCSWKLFAYDDDKQHSLYRETCVIFHQGATNSAMFKSLKKTHPEIKNGMVFKHLTSGNWVISLYNVYDDDWFHCGEFLQKTFKGGGHSGAAGATITEKQFIKLLHDKAIYCK